jgi:hypothetical protein
MTTGPRYVKACISPWLWLVAAGLVATATPAAAQTSRPVTFTKDVAPILQRSCQSCHRAGEMAPMSLLTYDEVRPWARAIKTRVSAREMPPWFIDSNIGIQKFKDNPSLTDDEVATIVGWVDGGAVEGNRADMPAPRDFADNAGWQIGKPDLVVTSPVYRVPATGPDRFGSLFSPLDLKEDRYIKAIQTMPANERSRRVVHHALAFTASPDDDTMSKGNDAVSDGGQFLVEYASGKNGEKYPEDSGVLLKAGQRIRFDYHLHSIGEAVDSQIQLGLVLYPKGYVPKHIRWSKQLGYNNTDLDIPAGVASVRRDGYSRMSMAAKIIAFQPHMHIRGQAQCLELIYPDASSEMINCAHFNYNWHLTYNYEDDAAPLVPAGTIVHIITWHDNSSSNRYNPDPRNWVGDGPRTIDEMSFSWIGWYDLTEEEYQKDLAARKIKRDAAKAKHTGQ